MDSQSRQSGPAYLRGMPGSSWAGATAARRPLSDQTRVNITRWAEEYISGVVRNHDGDSEQFRLDDLVRRALSARDDPATSSRTPTPATSGFDEWLSQATARS
jgi:hypothetical protein